MVSEGVRACEGVSHNYVTRSTKTQLIKISSIVSTCTLKKYNFFQYWHYTVKLVILTGVIRNNFLNNILTLNKVNVSS